METTIMVYIRLIRAISIKLTCSPVQKGPDKGYTRYKQPYKDYTGIYENEDRAGCLACRA